MKRAINIFAGLILTVVLAFGSQVASASALAQPNHFMLEPHSPMEVRVQPGPVTVTYYNFGYENIHVVADTLPEYKQTIVPSHQTVTEQFVSDVDKVYFIDLSFAPVAVSVEQQ